MPHADGRFFLTRMLPYRTTDDRIAGVVMTFMDITVRRRAEDERRVSEARFRAVADLVPDLLFSTDAAGQLVWCNRRWLDYSGQTLARVQGRRLVRGHPAGGPRPRADGVPGGRRAGAALLPQRAPPARRGRPGALVPRARRAAARRGGADRPVVRREDGRGRFQAGGIRADRLAGASASHHRERARVRHFFSTDLADAGDELEPRRGVAAGVQPSRKSSAGMPT